jgi:hypothetical protein
LHVQIIVLDGDGWHDTTELYVQIVLDGDWWHDTTELYIQIIILDGDWLNDLLNVHAITSSSDGCGTEESLWTLITTAHNGYWVVNIRVGVRRSSAVDERFAMWLNDSATWG